MMHYAEIEWPNGDKSMIVLADDSATVIDVISNSYTMSECQAMVDKIIRECEED